MQGGGTAARVIAEVYEEPQLPVHVWEADSMLLEACKAGFGAAELLDAGLVELHVGDALAANEGTVSGGFAGIIVDLFVGGMLQQELTKVCACVSTTYTDGSHDIILGIAAMHVCPLLVFMHAHGHS